jgi:hypothetical protein
LSLPAIVEGRSYLAGMVRIAISAAAFDASASTMPLGNVGLKPEREPDGSIRIWLDRRVVDRLNSMRRPHESLSDAILALAAGQ